MKKYLNSKNLNEIIENLFPELKCNINNNFNISITIEEKIEEENNKRFAKKNIKNKSEFNELLKKYPSGKITKCEFRLGECNYSFSMYNNNLTLNERLYNEGKLKVDEMPKHEEKCESCIYKSKCEKIFNYLG
ncbi:MAG: hypothetical protein QXY29_01155 [Candidatus Aenigmatarchaeota archaeon]